MKEPKSNNADQKAANDALTAPSLAQAFEKTNRSKYHTKGGHGFSAEDANNFADVMKGRSVEAVGLSNELNGADRLVDGLRVQSKYFRSAAETVASAFDSTSGAYRYSGQVLEVPKDQYEACVELMRTRIAQGRVPGFGNPADAEKIVQQGTVTYKQAMNIARAGNVDSLIFDAKTQAVTSSCVFAVSFIVTFARGHWSGESTREAITGAVEAALSAGGTTLITGIVSAQILRTRAAAVGVVSVRSGMRVISGTAIGRVAIQRVAAGSLGKAVYGAAAVNHVSKLLRSNAVTGTIVTVVTCTPDFYRALFDRSISWRQFTKNMSVNVAGVVGGSAGWIGGAAAGAAIGSAVPVVGTAAGGVIGGIIGALGGGFGGSTAAKAFADKIADDDSRSLTAVLKDEIEALACEYLLTVTEVERVVNEVARTATPKWLRHLFKATKKGTDEVAVRHQVRHEFEPRFQAIVQERPKLLLPSPDEVEAELLNFFDSLEMADCGQASTVCDPA